ncbi:MAG: hypothetical protein SOT18_05700 [Eubacterium sp.]|nr:hypothetical protein [Eubacterium sp.]
MKRKKKNKGVNRILRLVAVFMFLLLAHILINFNGLCHLSNWSSYDTVTASVTKKTTDLYLLLVPVVEVQYTYGEKEYTERKFFVIQKSFGLSDTEGSKLEIYVNKKAPNHVMFKTNFFVNPVNYLILVLEVVCAILAWRRFREYGAYKKWQAQENKMPVSEEVGNTIEE